MANLEGVNCWEDDTTGCVCGNGCPPPAATRAAWAADADRAHAEQIRRSLAAAGPDESRRAAVAATVLHFHAAGVKPSAASAILALLGVTRAELAQAQTDLKDARYHGI